MRLSDLLSVSFFAVMAALPAAAPALSAPVCDGAHGYAAAGQATFLWRPDAMSAVRAGLAGDPAYADLLRDADAALRASLGENLRPPVRFEPLDCHINDDAFAEAAVRTLLASLPTAAMEQSHAQDHR